MKFSIVIPAFDEGNTIGEVVHSVAGLGDVIVVDDGSTDETAALAAAAGATVVRHERNRGYDASLASGLAAAAERGCDAIATFDADGQLGVEGLRAALAHIANDGADIVIGTRDRHARFSEMVFGAYTRRRHGVTDILCGLKVFKTALYRKHAALADLPSVNTAIALAALRDGARLATVPIEVRPRRDEPRFGTPFRANWKILAVFFNALLTDFGVGR